MDTLFLFSSDRFSPTRGELDEQHHDYINPGCFAKELADFMDEKLFEHGYKVSFRCAEDWGHWLELEHEGRYTLAIGCSNMPYETEDRMAEHRVFISPDKPVIRSVRKLFRKLDVRGDVERLGDTIKSILVAESRIKNLQVEACLTADVWNRREVILSRSKGEVS